MTGIDSLLHPELGQVPGCVCVYLKFCKRVTRTSEKPHFSQARAPHFGFATRRHQQVLLHWIEKLPCFGFLLPHLFSGWFCQWQGRRREEGMQPAQHRIRNTVHFLGTIDFFAKGWGEWEGKYKRLERGRICVCASSSSVLPGSS